jgi:hypothetical protein
MEDCGAVPIDAVEHQAVQQGFDGQHAPNIMRVGFANLAKNFPL